MDYSHIDSTRNLNTTLFRNKFRTALCKVLLKLENRLNEEKTKDTINVHACSICTGQEKCSVVERKNRERMESEREKILKLFKVQETETWLENVLIGGTKYQEQHARESLCVLCHCAITVS